MSFDTQQQIESEVLNALVDAGRPLTSVALFNAAPTAGDPPEVSHVLHALVRVGTLARSEVNGRVYYRIAPARVPCDDTDAAHEPDENESAKSELLHDLEAVSDEDREAARAQLTAELIERFPEQARLAAYIIDCPGNVSGQIIRAAGSASSTARTLNNMAGSKRWPIRRAKVNGGHWRYYPAPGDDASAPATAAPEPPTTPVAHLPPFDGIAQRTDGRPAAARNPPCLATAGPARFGLWSDGTLSIQSEEGDVDLAPADCHALLQYLIRTRPAARAVLDDEATP